MENKLAYHVVGGGADEAFQIALFDRPTFLLGYLAAEERVYVCDQDLQVSSFAICGPLIAFQSAVLQCSQPSLPAEISSLIASIPSSLHAKLAIFLNRRGFVREALKLSPDADLKFALALQLGELKIAQSIAQSSAASSALWSELGRAALKAWNLPVAEDAFLRAEDLPSLFLLYAAGGDSAGLQRVAQKASAAGQVNLAFSAFFKAGDLLSAFELLMREGRPAEAAIFARTYALPADKICVAVEGWRAALKSRRGKAKLAEALADPSQNAELFEASLKAALPISPGRTRSVSFDGNVSVVGGSGLVQVVKPAEGADTSLASSVTDVFSDDQMSLEVNTAGTGTRLEDLDECELVEGMGVGEGEEADLDNLRELSGLGREDFSYGAGEEDGLAEAVGEISLEAAESIEAIETVDDTKFADPVEMSAEPVQADDFVYDAEQFEPEQLTHEEADYFAYGEGEPVEEFTYEPVEEEFAHEPVEEAFAHEPVDQTEQFVSEPVVEPFAYEPASEQVVANVHEANDQIDQEKVIEEDPYESVEVEDPFAYQEEATSDAIDDHFTYEEEPVEPFTYEASTEPFTYEASAVPFEPTEPAEPADPVEAFAPKESTQPTEAVVEKKDEVHEEIDFGGDGDADGWL